MANYKENILAKKTMLQSRGFHLYAETIPGWLSGDLKGMNMVLCMQAHLRQIPT
jgi:hypothetical protein